MPARLVAVILALIAAACLMAPAHARNARPPMTTFCLMGSGWNDGCMQAPQTGSEFHTDCFASNGYINQMSAVATNYVGNRPPTNVPGCDYPVGFSYPLASLSDPASGIPGCTWNPTGGGDGSGLTTCSSLTPSNNVIDGYNFGPVGGHGCTSLKINAPSPNTTPVTISNSYFFNDSGACTIATGGFPFQLLQNGSTFPIILLNDTFDGNGLVWPTKWGACRSSLTTCNATEAFAVNAATIKYSVAKNYSGRPLNTGNTNVNFGLESGNNFFVGWDLRDPTAHAELFLPNGLPGLTQHYMHHSVWLQTTGEQVSGNAPFPTSFKVVGFTGSITGTTLNVSVASDPELAAGLTVGGAGVAPNTTILPLGTGGTTGTGGTGTYALTGGSQSVGSESMNGIPTIGALTIDHILNVPSFVGGATFQATGVTACLAGDAGCSTPGNRVFITGISTGTVGSGEILASGNCGGIGGTLVYDNQSTNVTPAGPGGGAFGGVGSSWGMDTTVGSFTFVGHVGPASTTLTVETSGLLQIMPGVTITGGGMTAAVVQPYGTGGTTGTGLTGTYALSGGAQTVANGTTLTSNVPDYLSGGWSVAAPITCTAQNLRASPSGRPFLNFNNNYYGTVSIHDNWADNSSFGSTPTDWDQTGNTSITQCGAVATFSNNYDPSGLINSTDMNQWNTFVTGSGCQ